MIGGKLDLPLKRRHVREEASIDEYRGIDIAFGAIGFRLLQGEL